MGTGPRYRPRRSGRGADGAAPARTSSVASWAVMAGVGGACATDGRVAGRAAPSTHAVLPSRTRPCREPASPAWPAGGHFGWRPRERGVSRGVRSDPHRRPRADRGPHAARPTRPTAPTAPTPAQSGLLERYVTARKKGTVAHPSTPRPSLCLTSLAPDHTTRPTCSHTPARRLALPSLSRRPRSSGVVLSWLPEGGAAAVDRPRIALHPQ
jgi:hypothetical protein